MAKYGKPYTRDADAVLSRSLPESLLHSTKDGTESKVPQLPALRLPGEWEQLHPLRGGAVDSEFPPIGLFGRGDSTPGSTAGSTAPHILYHIHTDVSATALGL